MNVTEFKAFHTLAQLNGIKEVEYMGYMWISLTPKQLNKMCDLALAQGYSYKEGWIELKNGFRIKHMEEK